MAQAVMIGAVLASACLHSGFDVPWVWALVPFYLALLWLAVSIF